MKIDKAKYKKYKMSDIADSISKRVDPAGSKANIYVGLEHLDPENMHIREFGKPVDVKGEKLEVSKGDIIFGKRRAYQRKAAIADFDGICSAHAMVLRANPKVITPELLPFFIHSDVFMNRAIDISEGSLSPTIKWKILKEQEFLLPTLNEQKKLSDLLWAGDKVLQMYRELERELMVHLDTKLSLRIKSSTGNTNTLSELTIENPRYGASLKAKPKSDNEPRYIRITDINNDGTLNKDTIMAVDADDKDIDKYKLNNDDILLVRTADPGKSFIYKQSMGDSVYAGYLIKFVLDKKMILPDYFYVFSKTNNYWNQIKRRQKKGTLSNINANQFGSIKIKVPELTTQKEIVNLFYELRNNLESIAMQISKQEKLNKSLINQIFG